MFKKQKAV